MTVANKWDDIATGQMNIAVKNVTDMFCCMELPAAAKRVVLPEWTDTNWLMTIDLVRAPYSNSIKTLLQKTLRVVVKQGDTTGVLVDGFMSSFLYILGFDDYPYTMYPQYTYSTPIGPGNRVVKTKADFGVLFGNRKMLLVDDSTVTTATYANKWNEDRIIGKLFIAVLSNVTNSHNIEYPVIVYAVRVVGTLFTFYKAAATLDYIKESLRSGMAMNNDLVVERHPPVEDNPSGLTAYDMCNPHDRTRILECLCSIKKS